MVVSRVDSAQQVLWREWSAGSGGIINSRLSEQYLWEALFREFILDRGTRRWNDRQVYCKEPEAQYKLGSRKHSHTVSRFH